MDKKAISEISEETEVSKKKFSTKVKEVVESPVGKLLTMVGKYFLMGAATICGGKVVESFFEPRERHFEVRVSSAEKKPTEPEVVAEQASPIE